MKMNFEEIEALENQWKIIDRPSLAKAKQHILKLINELKMAKKEIIQLRSEQLSSPEE